MVQTILVYVVLAVAVGYLVKKYLLPQLLPSHKKDGPGCGSSNCKCND